MSRNFRHKTPATPGKKTARKTARRNSRATDSYSSDGDYAGVDLISDSEEDEPDVEEVEEQAIIESEEEDDTATPRPSNDEYQSSWDGFDMSPQEKVLGDGNTFFDDQMARMTKTDLYTQAMAGHTDDDDTPEARRVRFDLSDSSSESDDEENIFPDIFLEQNQLDPSFRKIIENADENLDDNASSNEGSYWDFNGSERGDPTDGSDEADDIADFANDDDSSSIGSSGYETDEGETTEEDIPEEGRNIPPRSILRRPTPQMSSDDEEEVPLIRRQFRSQGPRLAMWTPDVTKAYAVLDSRGKKLIMYKAKARGYSFNGSSNINQMGFSTDLDVGTPGTELMSPDPANLMMSAMYTPLDNMMGANAVGPPEAFFPFTSIQADGTFVQDSASSYDDDELSDEDLWNIEDLVNFGDNSSDDEAPAGEGDESANTDADPVSSTPARPPTSTNESIPLLNHLSTHNVALFRRNQESHSLISRNTASRDSLAFSGPFSQGTLRGIKKGSLAAANTPITPLRRQRVAKATLPPSSPGSPLAAAAHKKRKHSSGDATHSHKRSRSNLV